MLSWLLEVGFVISRSLATQFALFMALVSGVGLGLYGEYLAQNLEFTGPARALTEVLRAQLQHRLDRAGGVLAICFLMAAARCYRRARRRLLG